MATIRDVVEALARRGGVDAVVVVGRDGLPIDARAADGLDAENVAALLPSVINGLAQLGPAASPRRRRRAAYRVAAAPAPGTPWLCGKPRPHARRGTPHAAGRRPAPRRHAARSPFA